MPRGDKSAYTDKQKRQAEHIEEGYESRGVPEGEAERRAWATVNRELAAVRRAAVGVASQKTMHRHERAVSSVVRQPLHGLPGRVPPLRRRQRPRGSAKPLIPESRDTISGRDLG